jgi:hypothetical protein
MKHISFFFTLLLGASLHAADTTTLEADLLIVGGNESACAAAVQAARLGVKRIVLVNDIDWLGGQFSAEGVGCPDSEEELQKVILASPALFGGADLATTAVGTLIKATASAPSTEVDLANIPQVADLLVTLGLATSKGDAGRLMKGGGFYINNQQVEAGSAPTLSADHFLGSRLCILRKGKKSYATVRATGA